MPSKSQRLRHNFRIGSKEFLESCLDRLPIFRFRQDIERKPWPSIVDVESDAIEFPSFPEAANSSRQLSNGFIGNHVGANLKLFYV